MGMADTVTTAGATEASANPIQQFLANHAAKQAATKAPETAPAPSKAPEAPASADASKTEQLKESIEAKGQEAPEQKSGESDKDYELRLSKYDLELKRTRKEANQWKREAEDKSARLKELESELLKAKAKRLTKKEFIQLNKDLIAGKSIELDDDDIDALPESVRKEWNEIKQWKQEQQEREQQARFKDIETKELAVVSSKMKECEDEFPLFSLRGNAAEHIRDTFYQHARATGRAPDLHKVMADIHGGLAEILMSALKAEKSREYLFKQDPELRTLLGPRASDSQPGEKQKAPNRNADGLRSLTNSLSQDAPVQVQDGPLSEEEERARIVDRWKAHLRAQGE